MFTLCRPKELKLISHVWGLKKSKLAKLTKENLVGWNTANGSKVVALFSRDIDQRTPDDVVKEILGDDYSAVESIADLKAGTKNVLAITPQHHGSVFDKLNKMAEEFGEPVFVVYKGSSSFQIYRRMVEKTSVMIDVSGNRFDFIKVIEY